MSQNNKVKYVKTDKEAKNGALICPSCGSSDVTYDIKNKILKCNYCLLEYDSKDNTILSAPLETIEGEIRGSGTKDIKKKARKVSLICNGCGAKVTVNMKDTPTKKCHWCGNILSVNKQSTDGTIPDKILPFSVSREEAVSNITQYIKKKKIFADTNFLRNYKEEDIIGVYLPYLLLDIRGHAKLKGDGEKSFIPLRRIIPFFSSNHDTAIYDAKLYNLKRDFDFNINNLSLESTKHYQGENIINSIMPFDTENCIKYQSNYIYGYQYEIRDLNIPSIEKIAMKQVKGIIRYAAKPSIIEYDRGVKWTQEDITVDSKRWESVYLPVWLYNYKDKKGKTNYIAVNGRTKETIGKIPLKENLLYYITIAILVLELLPIIAFVYKPEEYLNTHTLNLIAIIPIIMLLTFISPFIITLIYNKRYSRHFYEKETDCTLDNLTSEDIFEKKEYGLDDRFIKNRNDNKLLLEEEKY